ncbi:MAG: tRNA (adenosine(37)-N6)-dimethylallyltransferase MiaA [Pseudomonadota bacterium]
MQRAQKTGKMGRVLLIAGPTASGKSALAMRLAERLGNTVIINTDSMQIYRDLRIVTARPSAQEEARFDHVLYGTQDGANVFSLALWRDAVADRLQNQADGPLKDADDKQTKADCEWTDADGLPQNADQSLIFVGGTGLYFRALTQGISPIPDIPEKVRRTVRDRMIDEGAPALHAELDKAMADQLSPTDSQRVARALEVLLATGKSLADWQALPPEGALLNVADTRHVVLAPPRDWLEARIRQRAETMLCDAALEEVRALRARDLSSELPVMRAIGVSLISAYLDGDMSRDAALDALTIETRRYAKRQSTWFRGQMGDWPRLDPSVMSVDAMADQILNEGDG